MVALNPKAFMDAGLVFSINHRLPAVDMETITRDVARALGWVTAAHCVMLSPSRSSSSTNSFPTREQVDGTAKQKWVSRLLPALASGLR